MSYGGALGSVALVATLASCQTSMTCPLSSSTSLGLTPTDAQTNAPICNATATMLSIEPAQGFSFSNIAALLPPDSGIPCNIGLAVFGKDTPGEVHPSAITFSIRVSAPGYADVTLPNKTVAYDSCGDPKNFQQVAFTMQRTP